MSVLFHDLRLALRLLAKRPAFALVIVVTLALGIGGNTAVFTVTKGVLFHSPPISEPNRVFSVFGTSEDGSVHSVHPYPAYLELKERCNAFSDLCASCSQPGHVGTAEQAERLQTNLVSGNYFSMLGVVPALGRLFAESDDVVSGGHPIAVLSYTSWKTRFAGDPSIIGKQVTLNGHPFSVIGVAAKGFQGTTLGKPNEVWVPTAMYNVMNPMWARIDPLHNRNFSTFDVIGRLAPEVPVQHARDQLASVSQELHPGGLGGFSGGRLVPLLESTTGVDRRAAISSYMRLLLVVAGLVLLIACANVANMLMARTLDRRRELAIRGALGAGRWRITRQLLTESVALAILGGGLGLLASTWITDILLLLIPEGESLARASIDLTLDTRVYVFTLGIAVLTGVALGLTLALQAMAVNLVSALKGQSSMGRRGKRWYTFPNLLVAGQVAVSFLLLMIAGLLVQTLTNMRNTHPGFEPAGTLLASVDVRRQGYDSPAQQAFQEQALQRVRALPGVISVGLAGAVPPHNRSSLDLRLEGHRESVGARANVACNIVSPGYFSTMRIPLLAGRTFDDRDNDDAQSVAVINASMATRYWDDGEGAIGQSFHVMGKTFNVVGIVEDSTYHTLREEAQPFTYFCMSQMQMLVSTITILTRTADHPMAQVSAIRATVGELDPALPLFDVQTLDEHLGAAMSQERMLAWSSGAFSVLALVLTGIGLFGVMSCMVSRRVREIGIRRALGAQNVSLVWMVLGRASVVLLVGMATGLAGTVATTRLLEGRLYGILPTDPATFVAVTLLLGAAALLACYIPARRATKVDPMVALRCE